MGQTYQPQTQPHIIKSKTFVQPYNGYSIYKVKEYGHEYWLVTDEVVLTLKVLTSLVDLVVLYSLLDPK